MSVHHTRLHVLSLQMVTRVLYSSDILYLYAIERVVSKHIKSVGLKLLIFLQQLAISVRRVPTSRWHIRSMRISKCEFSENFSMKLLEIPD